MVVHPHSIFSIFFSARHRPVRHRLEQVEVRARPYNDPRHRVAVNDEVPEEDRRMGHAGEYSEPSLSLACETPSFLTRISYNLVA